MATSKTTKKPTKAGTARAKKAWATIRRNKAAAAKGKKSK